MNQLNACRLIDNQTSDISIANQRHDFHNEAEIHCLVEHGKESTGIGLQG